MTGGVEQTLPRSFRPNAGADRQQHGKGEQGLGFDQALGKDNAPSHGATANGRPVTEATDEAPEWIRFGSKLGAAINRIPVLHSKAVPADGAAEPAGADFPYHTSESALVDDADEPRTTGHADDGLTIDAVPGPVIQPDPPAPAHDGADLDNIKGGDPTGNRPPVVPVSSAAAPSVMNAGDTAQLAQRGTTLHRQRNDDASAAGGEHPAGDHRATGKGASREGQAELSSILAKSAASDQAPSPRREQAVGLGAANAEHSAKETDLKSEHSEQARLAARATVLSEQSFPAPVRSTSLALAETLAMTGSLKFVPGGPLLGATLAPLHTAPAHSLSLQLHPAELGMVTATLKIAGEQLTVELQVENDDAYRTLATDSETLVKSLRAMGYDIDRVTVLQPAAQTSTQARGDTPASSQAPFRQGNEQMSSGGSGNGGTGSRQPEGGSSNASANTQGASMGNRDDAGGVYI